MFGFCIPAADGTTLMPLDCAPEPEAARYGSNLEAELGLAMGWPYAVTPPSEGKIWFVNKSSPRKLPRGPSSRALQEGRTEEQRGHSAPTLTKVGICCVPERALPTHWFIVGVPRTMHKPECGDGSGKKNSSPYSRQLVGQPEPSVEVAGANPLPSYGLRPSG